MLKVKVMIVEDMPFIAEDIASKLRKHNMEVVGIFDAGENAIAAVESLTPDLILMDIQLAGAMDGISAAKVITDKYPVPLIYLSDFTDSATVSRATKTLPANYLAKPFLESDLVRAINIAFANAQATGKVSSGVAKDHIFIKVDTGHMKLSFDDIYFVEASGAYCKIFTADKNYMQSISMNHVLDQLDPKVFVRIHRSHAVNIKKITGIDGNVVRVGAYKVEMSKTLRNDLLERLNFLK